MKAGPVFWIVVVALGVMHFLLHVGLGLGPVAPDLATVALLLASREAGMGAAAGAGFGLGLLEDALSVLSFGANGVAMALVGIVGSVSRDLFVGDSLIFLVSFFSMGKLLRDVAHWVMVGEELRQPFVDQILVQGTLGALYAAFVGVVVLAVTGLWREPAR
jgi:rod shape-determining protein MreD